MRIGVAVSDSNASLALPVETVSRETGFKDQDTGDIDRILELIREYHVVAVHDSPKPPAERVTLTLPAVNRSQRVWFLVSW